MPRRPNRLPKAPLAEVVFELRWELQAGPENAPILQTDPGLIPLLHGFTSRIKELGFSEFKDMSHPLQTGAHGVVRRFFKRKDLLFPLMQIGPGIFASNEASEYEWKAFKKQIKSGLRVLLAVYPKLKFFTLRPKQIELRYIDTFGKSLLGKAALFDFTEKGTSLKFGLPKMLNDTAKFSGDAVGRFVFQRPLKGRKNSLFILDLGSGSAKSNDMTEDVVRMESKVISTAKDVPQLKTPTAFLTDVDDWLEFAHGITSPFFKEFILPDVMRKFEGD